MNNEQQTQQADDPSGDGWRDVGDKEPLQSGDMYLADNYWRETNNVGGLAYGHGIRYRRRIQPQQQAETNPDDPSGPGWRSLTTGNVTQDSQMLQNGEDWVAIHDSETLTIFRRHTEPPQPPPDHPSDSEATPDDDRRHKQWAVARLLEQVGVELQDLPQQLKEAMRSKAELERAVQRYQNQLTGAQEQVERLSRELLAERDRCAKSLAQSYNAGCDAAISTIEKWLSPVVGLMAEEPEDCGPLATVLLGYLPQIALRLIEEKRQ